MGAFLAFAGGTFFFLALLWFAARGAITLCILEVHNGEIVVSRGHLAPRVLADLRDVVRRPRVRRATLRLVREREAAALRASGDLSEQQLQQLRNIVGNVPLAKLTTGRGKKKRGTR